MSNMRRIIQHAWEDCQALEKDQCRLDELSAPGLAATLAFTKCSGRSAEEQMRRRNSHTASARPSAARQARSSHCRMTCPTGARSLISLHHSHNWPLGPIELLYHLHVRHQWAYLID